MSYHLSVGCLFHVMYVHLSELNNSAVSRDSLVVHVLWFSYRT